MLKTKNTYKRGKHRNENDCKIKSEQMKNILIKFQKNY